MGCECLPGKACVVFILLLSVPGTEASTTHSGEKQFFKKKEYIPELSGLFKVTEQLAVRQEPRPPDAPSARLSVLHEPNSGVLKKGQ